MAEKDTFYKVNLVFYYFLFPYFSMEWSGFFGELLCNLSHCWLYRGGFNNILSPCSVPMVGTKIYVEFF